MWAAIFIIVIALILVLAAPKPKIENARAANLGDFQFPRSREGDPVPWFLGTVRLRSPNSLWYGDYTPIAITKKQKTGLFSSKRVTVGYKYHVGLDLCWALGGAHPVTLRKLWSDKHVFWEGQVSTPTTLTVALPNLFGGEEQRGGLSGRIDFYPGTFNEERNPYLVEKADPDVPAYIGQARTVFRGNIYVPRLANPEASGYTAASGFYFGTTTNVNAIHAEMSRYSSAIDPVFSIMPNGLDVNPMELLYAGFTDKFGMPGVSPADIDMPSWRACAQTLYNEGFGMSLLVQQSITGKDLCEEVLRIADGILYQDTDSGKMVAVLIRDDYDIDDLPVLDESIIKELVSFNKTTWDQTYNQCRVVFKDRSNEYADRAAVAQDFANINFQNRVKNVDINVPGCFVNEEANELATRQLSLLSVPLFQIEIRCNRRANKLKPGGVFIFNWGPYGISNMVMRVQKIDKGTLDNGVITIHAVQDRFATSLAVFAPPSDTGWVNPIGAPVPMSPEALFELPFEISGAEGAIIASLGTRMQSVDMGYLIYTGEEELTEESARVIDVNSFTPSALLAAPYPADTDARDEAGFPVSSVKQSEMIVDATEDELLSGASVALIRSAAGDELIAWKLFDGAQVEDVIRGIFGTIPLSHPVGAEVFFISSGYGLVNEDDPYTVLPRAILARLLPYNGRGQLQFADAEELELDVMNKAQRPAVPGQVRVNGADVYGLGTVVGAFVVSWAHRSRLDVQVRTQDDPSVDVSVIEPGTTYNLRVWDAVTDALLIESLNGDASNATIRLAHAGQVRVELSSAIGSIESYSTHRFQFNYDPAGETANQIVFDESTVIFDGGRV